MFQSQPLQCEQEPYPIHNLQCLFRVVSTKAVPWFRVSKRLKRQRVEGDGGKGGKETPVQPEHDFLLVQIKESDKLRKINRFNYAATFDKFVV